MGTPSLQPFLKTYWLTPAKWLANCREACKYELERQYKCGARDNYVRIFFITLLNLGYGLNYYSSRLRFAHSDLKDAFIHIQIAPHHRRFSEICCQLSRKSTVYQYSVLPSGLLWPHALSKCTNAALPPQIEWKAHPQLSGWLADFSSVPGYAYHPHRLAAYSLGVPRAMCQHAESILAPASREITWGWEPRSRGIAWRWKSTSRESSRDQFVFPVPFQARQLCSVEGFSETAQTQGGGFSGMSSGIITHAPLQLWLKSRVPWTSGYLRIVATSKLWCNPDLFSRGVPLCSVASRVMVTTDASTHGWGAVCEGMPASGL